MRRRRRLAALLLGAGWLLAGCGGGGGGNSTFAPPPPPPPPSVTADIQLLFMGNSHTSVHNVPEMVAALVRTVRPGRTVLAVNAPNFMTTQERSADAASLQLLNGRNWSFVVLQAQQYSQSGMFFHPTSGTESLIRATRAIRAIPVLFPEWARRGVIETQLVYDIHVAIAMREPACVAPIGQAWELALARYPGLVLHDADGNHSAPAGALLAALVIATTITGSPPTDFPAIAEAPVPAEVQAQLRAAAAETVLAYRPRQHCPADPI